MVDSNMEWRTFRAMVRAMRKVYPRVKNMIMPCGEFLLAIGDPMFDNPIANNDNQRQH